MLHTQREHEIDPIFIYLLRLLPPAGRVFPRQKRELWLTAMRAIIDFVYEDTPPPLAIKKREPDPLIGVDFPAPERA